MPKRRTVSGPVSGEDNLLAAFEVSNYGPQPVQPKPRPPVPPSNQVPQTAPAAAQPQSLQPGQQQQPAAQQQQQAPCPAQPVQPPWEQYYQNQNQGGSHYDDPWSNWDWQ